VWDMANDNDIDNPAAYWQYVLLVVTLISLFGATLAYRFSSQILSSGSDVIMVGDHNIAKQAVEVVSIENPLQTQNQMVEGNISIS
jgi:Na+-driven multidrug efflux pump